MPVEIYEIVALAARFWFLFLMVLIVWRSYRWYARERSQRKKRLRLLPDAGYIGEFVVLQGAGDLERGQVLSVPFEGTLGFVRSNDLCVPAPGVATRHLWFSYDSKQGLVLTPIAHNDFAVDQLTLADNPEGLCMAHGSRLYIGECELRLRMFAGYEVGMVMSPYGDEPTPDVRNGDHPLTQEQLFQLFDQSAGFDPYMETTLYDEELEQEALEPEETVDACEPEQEASADETQETVEAAEAAPAAEPAETEPVFHPLVDDEDWPEDDDGEMTFNAQPKGENIFASAYRANTVKAAAERAKETARQKAGVSEPAPVAKQPVPAQPRQPAPPAPVAPETRPTFAPAASPAAKAAPQPARPKSLLTRPASLTPPPKLGKPSKVAKPQTFAPVEEEQEAWPIVPRPEGWRSEGLFDDLVDEDGTDASMPPKSAYVGRDEAAWAKRQVWDKYFGGGDAP